MIDLYQLFVADRPITVSLYKVKESVQDPQLMELYSFIIFKMKSDRKNDIPDS